MAVSLFAEHHPDQQTMDYRTTGPSRILAAAHHDQIEPKQGQQTGSSQKSVDDNDDPLVRLSLLNAHLKWGTDVQKGGLRKPTGKD